MKYLVLISIVAYLVSLYPLYVSADLTYFTEDQVSKNSIEYKRISRVKSLLFGNGQSNDVCGGYNNTDLSSIAGQDWELKTQTDYWYQLRICGIVSQIDCQKVKGSLCQYFVNSYQYTHMLAIYTSSAATWSLATAANGGIQVNMSNGDICGSTGLPRTVVMIFSCNVNATGPTYLWSVAQSGSCGYIVNFPTSAACYKGGGGGGGGDGGSKGLSGGTIFLIILIVLIPVYIFAGCLYKRQKNGAAGTEACPNVELWRALPGYIKEGFVFTWTKIRSLCNKSGGEGYQAVK